MLDFHTHILPGTDDGSSSAEQSLQMLRMYGENVTDIFLTPHFYAYSDRPDHFLEKRAASFEKLSFAVRDIPHPAFHLGAEVYYFEGIQRSEEVRKLSLEGTNLILIEMPFAEWDISMIRNLLEMKRNFGLTPVLAHIDRYGFGEGPRKKCMETYLAGGGLVQVNAEPCFSFFKRKKVISGILGGKIHFLGSDAHNTGERKPNFNAALDVLAAKIPDVSERFSKYEKQYIKGSESAL